ncbi:unnamed protein product [Miscanthus lutarioriparius]|uniref:Sugar phosphate transporter domain-containing protein n=1 Tax=Miscanthus lutarioriparius TaxID=422564 RepID=A0A811QIG1_9POAL|nr:unnamed protein product [Miscanthus lutarioriparius]
MGTPSRRAHVLSVLGRYIILKDPFSARNVVGILIAIFGMGLYSYYSVVESRKKTEAASSLPVATQYMSSLPTIRMLMMILDELHAFDLRLYIFDSAFIFRHPFKSAFILLSCSIAVCVNFSTFLVIGTTSPVTYQVLGHVKTCLVLSFGYIILKDPFSARNVVGILIAIFGMGLYSYYSVVESRKKTEAASSLPVATQILVRSHARRRIGAGRYNTKKRRVETVFVTSKKVERSGP